MSIMQVTKKEKFSPWNEIFLFFKICFEHHASDWGKGEKMAHKYPKVNSAYMLFWDISGKWDLKKTKQAKTKKPNEIEKIQSWLTNVFSWQTKFYLNTYELYDRMSVASFVPADCS